MHMLTEAHTFHSLLDLEEVLRDRTALEDVKNMLQQQNKLDNEV